MRLVGTFVFFASVAASETNRDAIAGTVADQSESVVPGSSITVLSLGTDETRRLTASNNGTFTVSDLQPVQCRVTPTARGFNQTVVENVKVDAAATTTVTAILQRGSVGTKVANGYKYYQVRNAYSTTFGTLCNNSQPRYIQFGLKLYF